MTLSEAAGSFTVKKQGSENVISTANAGDIIVLAATTNSGYKFTNFTITNNDNSAAEDVELKPTENANEFTFTMPAKAITVTANFESTASTEIPGTESSEG